MEPSLRQIFFRRLCSKDEPWAVIFVTNYPSIGEYVDRPGDSALFFKVLGVQPQLRVLPYSRLHPSIYVTPRCSDLFQKPPSSEGFPIG